MIFNTASTMTNLSLNSQNRLFSCSAIGLLIGFLFFHLIKISFVKPEECTIIFSTASSVNKFMEQRNNSTLRYECDETFSDDHTITLVKKTFFARVSYEILYHEVWNKKIKNVYVAAHAPPFFFFTYKDILRNPRFVG